MSNSDEQSALTVSPDEKTRDSNDTRVQLQELKHKQSIEDKRLAHEIEDVYESCCCGGGRTDKRLLTYITSSVILGSVLIFSCVGLVRSDTCESTQTYIGLVSLILGVFVGQLKSRTTK